MAGLVILLCQVFLAFMALGIVVQIVVALMCSVFRLIPTVIALGCMVYIIKCLGK